MCKRLENSLEECNLLNRRGLINESMVCTCSIAYMRAGIGIDCLVVCLSEYLPLRIVYRISSMSMTMIAVYFRGLFREEITNRHFLFKCRLGLTCCPQGKRRSNHEINRYVYRP